MKLELGFYCRYASAVHLSEYTFSLAKVSEIRKSLGLNIDISRIENFVDYFRKDFYCSVDEEFARESGRFETEACVHVKCEKGVLNEFVYERIDKSINERTGEVLSVKIIRELDKSSVLEMWKKEGYPLVLNVSKCV